MLAHYSLQKIQLMPTLLALITKLLTLSLMLVLVEKMIRKCLFLMGKAQRLPLKEAS
ncbi:hypothetical protein SAMN05192555_13010 [Franzmannia pantelleriensis]|uniref:Uncharacterized protein n=1 Tax=Franzmannia pantelleriensis TaxID=48727 RepID=A0A1G9XCT5_9GAMM|nr:hypothetical protein SAMN05192555_13010 [Halomonas pantelleriensis]